MLNIQNPKALRLLLLRITHAISWPRHVMNFRRVNKIDDEDDESALSRLK